MSDRSEPAAPSDPAQNPRDRLIYVVPSDADLVHDVRRGSLRDLWRTLWQGRWAVTTVTAVFIAAAVIYALTADARYRAEVLLVPGDSKSDSGSITDQLGSLGGLAGLAGISIGGASSAEPLAVLTSRGFVRSFIEENNLLPLLFADKWDKAAARWKASVADDPPDIHDAVRKFTEKVLRVEEEQKKSLVTVGIEWTDPGVAATWANALVEKLNDRMRQRALREAEANVEYLKQELLSAEVVALQQSIGRLLQNELQKAMLARGNREFAFRIVDPAAPPKWRVWPKRVQIVALAAVLGLLLSSIGVLACHSIRASDDRGL